MAKFSKCSFGTTQVDYLGHIIEGGRVSTDSKKIRAVKNWLVPNNIKQLRGFLGLARYYRRFIKNYGLISKPFTELLRKDNFIWTEAATLAFGELKSALTSAPVLALPSPDREFVVETDASDGGMGTILMQDQHPIAYISKALAKKHQSLSVYEKELMAVVHAVKKWDHYLGHRKFQIRTNHRSLKFLLEQRITTTHQQKYIAKLFGYDFEISYKKGSENRAADALSRLPMVDLVVLTFSTPVHSFMPEIQASWETDPELAAIIANLKVKGDVGGLYTWQGVVLRRKGKILTGKDAILRNKVIQLMHDTAQGGHSGALATAKRIGLCFFR